MIDSDLFAKNMQVMQTDTDCSRVSDGDHTFEELYYHRMILTAALVNSNPDSAWRSKLHDDGTMFDGYFIVGIDTAEGAATYHYKIDYWNLFKCKQLPMAPKWDGHTPQEAIDRIKNAFVHGRYNMNYHTIMHDDMRNGDGLRVVLFVSGCSHNCPGCHNPQTHDPKSGKRFDKVAFNEICEYLNRDYTSGITFSGGDPLFESNLDDIYELVKYIKYNYPTKNIWMYTGYTYDQIKKDPRRLEIVNMVDVLVDGPFVEALADKKYKWAGSTNQNVIRFDR